MDTGSGHDLVDLALVMQSARIINTDHQNLTLMTANGECRPPGSIPIRVEALGETTNALVLENTPNVISVGLRCMEYGYGFHWPPAETPYWITPDGREILCRVENNVPLLPSPGLKAVSACELAQSSEVQDHCDEGKGTPCSSPLGEQSSSGGCLSADAPCFDPLNHDGSTSCGGCPPAEDMSEVTPLSCAPVTESGDDVVEAEAVATDDEDANETYEGPRDLKADAHSLRHLLTHCPRTSTAMHVRGKAQRKSCRRGATSGFKLNAKDFGDLCTRDHIIAYDDLSRGIRNEREALAVKDIATGCISGFPLMTKSSEDASCALKEFTGPYDRIKCVHSDPAPELRASLAELDVAFDPAATGVKANNGIAERVVRTIVEGTRTLLECAGMPQAFWPFAMRSFNVMYNVTHRLADGSTHGHEGTVPNFLAH